MGEKSAYYFALTRVQFRWRTYFIYSFASILSIPARLVSEGISTSELSRGLLTGLCLTIITSPLLWAGFKTLEDVRRTQRVWLVTPFMLIAAFGAIRGFVLHYLLPTFGLKDNLSAPSSALSSMVYTFVFFNVSSFFVELLMQRKESFRKEFSQATLERLKYSASTEENDGIVDYTQSMKMIKDAVAQHLPLSGANATDIEAAAAEIQKQIQEVLKPLSHRLWISSFGEIKVLKVSEIVKDAIRAPNFSLRLFLAYQFFVGLFGMWLVLGFADALIKSIAGTLTSCVITLVYRYLNRKHQMVSFLSGFTFLLLIAALPIVAGLLTTPDSFSSNRLIGGLFIAPTLPILIFISSLFRLILDDQKFAIAAAKSVRLQQARQLSTDPKLAENRNLAGYLHNSLQSELLRISKQLEQVADSSEDTAPHVSALEEALGRSLDDVSKLQSKGLDRLRDIADAWTGIAEIQIHASNDLSIAPEKSNMLVELIEEMITNSVRHGEASKITIVIAKIGDELSVEVTHNGHEIHNDGIGLGSAWIASESTKDPRLDIYRNRVTYSLAL